jgi:hypothetical protein
MGPLEDAGVEDCIHQQTNFSRLQPSRRSYIEKKISALRRSATLEALGALVCKRKASPPTHAVWSLIYVGTQNRQLVVLLTHGLRTNATPYSPATTNAVWFRVFHW